MIVPLWTKRLGIDVTDTQTYFTDAMGVEYLGYIMSRCHALKLMAKVTVCRCELPSITSRNKEFWDVLSTDRFPIISVDKIDKIKHHGEEGYDYSREDRKLPIHLIRELELIDELLKKIKTNLTNGDYQKAILIADHGASRLAVIHGTENLWEMQSSGKHSGRCCPKSEVDERPDSATDAEDFWALANYGRLQPYLLEEYGNASQPYSFARAPKKALRESREIIAQCIGAQPDEIFFTSGGTESNNWAIKGTAFLDPEKHGFITSAIEHHAILRPCADIERMGYPVFYLPVDSTGKVNTATLSEHIAPDTRLVSIMAANNEIGSIQDIPALAAIAHSVGAMFHTDAVQAVGHIKIDVNDLGVDMLSASAHKFHGPKGIGFLYVRKGTPLAPYASGGSQENHMRAGTENIASIVGMAAALKKCVDGLKDTAEHLTRLETKLIMGLSDANVRFSRNGSAAHIPGNISLSFPGYSGEALLHRLDLMGICVSTGSACNSRETQISHVLQAIKLEPELAKGTIRLSLGKNNTEGDIDEIVDALLRILK